jgi:hypothetical protein
MRKTKSHKFLLSILTRIDSGLRLTFS